MSGIGPTYNAHDLSLLSMGYGAPVTPKSLCEDRGWMAARSKKEATTSPFICLLPLTSLLRRLRTAATIGTFGRVAMALMARSICTSCGASMWEPGKIPMESWGLVGWPMASSYPGHVLERRGLEVLFPLGAPKHSGAATPKNLNDPPEGREGNSAKAVEAWS